MDTSLRRLRKSAYADNTIIVTKCYVTSDYVNKSVIDRRVKGDIKVTSRSVKPLFLLLRTGIVCAVQKWIIFCMLVSCVYGEQRFAIEPQDQTAVMGSRVTLPCRVEEKVGQLQWTKDDFGLGTHRHLTGYERYKMIGSDEEGDYSLDIKDVTLDDDGLYQCQVSSGPKGQPPIRSRYARLQILVPPEAPRILQGPTLQTVEDLEVSLECVSIGGKPAAEITWIDSEDGVINQGVSYTVEPMTDGHRFTARSILRLHPTRHHHNQTFTCQAQNTADRTYKSTHIKLQVNYAPKIRVFIKAGANNGRIQEGETVIIGCQASANPNNMTFRWYMNGDLLPGEDKNELVLHNVSRAYNEATVKCEVHNIVGRSADTKTLQISYGPSFKVKPQNMEGEMGSTVTLKCVVDGHPQPKLLWLRYEKERVIRVGKSSTLNVTVTKHSTGQYWCRGSVQGYSDIEAAATVFVKGPPKLLTNQTQYGTEGDSVRIECVSLSIPKPDYIIWSFGGNEINSFQDHEFAFLEEVLPDRSTKSTLVIRRSGPKHFGSYNCTVINAFGADSVMIHLVKDNTFPLIFIISGCSSAIIIILIVMLIIVLCHRKRSTKHLDKKSSADFEKKEKIKDSDQSSNISDLKLELRQVEGSCDVDNMGSETDLHPKLHLTSNLGLPLAGPVTLPDAGYDNEIMKHYQRYSGDFSQPISDLHLKPHTTTNGYIPYVDYAKDYAPPSDSLTGSLSRSIDSSVFANQNLLPRQASCGRLGIVGPDLIPNAGVFTEADARYAATYANPYLGAPTSYGSQVNTNPSAKPPPPYYTLRNSNFSPTVTSPSSSCSSRRMTSSQASSSPSSTAQPQVPKHSPQTSSCLYVLPASHGTTSSKHITTKGNASKLKGGTHV